MAAKTDHFGVLATAVEPSCGVHTVADELMLLRLNGSASSFANLVAHNGFLNVGCEYAACPGSAKHRADPEVPDASTNRSGCKR